MGGSAAARAFGYLHPYVRRRVPMAEGEAVVEGRHVAQRATRTHAGGRRGPVAEPTRERDLCAS